MLKALPQRDVKQVNTYMQKYTIKLSKLDNPDPQTVKLLAKMTFNLRKLGKKKKQANFNDWEAAEVAHISLGSPEKSDPHNL